MNENAAAENVLLERLVHGGQRPGRDMFIIYIGNNTDDTARLGADADKLHNGIGPVESPIQNVAPGAKLRRNSFAYNDHEFGAIAIVCGEIPARLHRHPESREIAGRNRMHPRMKVLIGSAADTALNPVSEARPVKNLVRPPWDAAADRNLLDFRHDTEAGLQLAIERSDIVRRPVVCDDGHIERQNPRRVEAGGRRLQGEKGPHEHDCACEKDEGSSNLDDGENVQLSCSAGNSGAPAGQLQAAITRIGRQAGRESQQHRCYQGEQRANRNHHRIDPDFERPQGKTGCIAREHRGERPSERRTGQRAQTA